METLKQQILDRTKELGLDVCGIASAELANEKAPQGFGPESQLKDSRTVIMFGIRMPTGSLNTLPDGKLQEIYYMRAFWTSSHLLDTVAYQIALLVEQESGYKSMAIPTYGPLRVHDGEPRGLVSLKHMAQLAGIGSIARNSLLVHPELGNLVRLGGVITQAPIPADPPSTTNPCPDDCRSCIEVCPVDAVKDYRIDIMKCMGISIRHPIMRPYSVTRFLMWLSKRFGFAHRFVEDLTNMIVVDYSESCTRCLRACPHYKTSMKWLGKRLEKNEMSEQMDMDG